MLCLLCCVVLCCVVLCCVVLCCVVSCRVVPCRFMSCHFMPCHVMSFHVMSHHIMSCHVMSYSYSIIYSKFSYFQVDILDGNVSRDSYGVLVIQSPTTPTDDASFPVLSPANEMAANGVYAAPATAAIVTQQNEEQIKGQGQAYRKHMPVVAAIKRKYWLPWLQKACPLKTIL